MTINDSKNDWEKLQAQLAFINEVPAKRQIAAPTADAAKRIWNKWEDFKKLPHNHYASPSLDALKLFFLWYAQDATGKFGKYPTAATIIHNAIIFGKVFREQTRCDIDKEILREIKNWIDTDLQHHLKLPRDCFEKRLATSQDLHILLDFLWYNDPFTFAHERYRVQLCFFIQLMAYSASRPGAITLHQKYLDTNQALTYKDLELTLCRGDGDKPNTIALTVKFSWMKGKRLDPSQFVKITMHQERKFLSRCPVLLVLALADADDAWADFESSEGILRYRFPPNRETLPLRFKDSIRDTQILRQAAAGTGCISDKRGWSSASSSSSLKQAGMRVGFKFELRPYDIRRGSANLLQAKATEAELAKQLGQKTAAIFQKYLSNHSARDLQGLCNDGVEDPTSISRVNSNMHTSAPMHLPEEERRKICLEPEYQILDQKRMDLLAQWAAKGKDPPAVYKLLNQRNEVGF